MAEGTVAPALAPPDADPVAGGVREPAAAAGVEGALAESAPVRWIPAPRTRNLATAALLALAAAIVTGHPALVLLAAPALAALALMPRRPRARTGELAVDVAVSGSRCFEGEDLTIT
ncbi:MAG TPA: hypothetical protein VIX15_07710, partial [Streptosporangiaceae bacterium]